MKDTCVQCGKDLTKVDEIHAVDGDLFCSEDCAIAYHINELITNAKELAKEWYNSNAEVVTPLDIGLLHERIWRIYDSSYDVTVTFRSVYLDAECEEVVSTEVLGFHWGSPSEKEDDTYTGTLKAYYD